MSENYDIKYKSPELKIEFDSYEYSNVKISDFLLDRAEKGYCPEWDLVSIALLVLISRYLVLLRLVFM